MKKLTALLSTLALCVCVCAQDGKFGYIDFNETLKRMPEYAVAQDTLRHIEEEYAQEIERSDTEFYRQYMEYIHGQKLMSASILQKRQKELQQLYDGSMEFKKIAKDSLDAERLRLLEPIQRKLSNTISRIGKKRGLDYVIDIKSGAYLYINNDRGIDITQEVYKSLGIKKNDNETDGIFR